jgi:hypothetical protein
MIGSLIGEFPHEVTNAGFLLDNLDTWSLMQDSHWTIQRNFNICSLGFPKCFCWYLNVSIDLNVSADILSPLIEVVNVVLLLIMNNQADYNQQANKKGQISTYR